MPLTPNYRFGQTNRAAVLRTASFRKLFDSAPLFRHCNQTISIVSRTLSVNAHESWCVTESVKVEIQQAQGQPAKDAPDDKTKEGEVWNRFVAFEKDNRVRANGSGRDGTGQTILVSSAGGCGCPPCGAGATRT